MAVRETKRSLRLLSPGVYNAEIASITSSEAGIFTTCVGFTPCVLNKFTLYYLLSLSAPSPESTCVASSGSTSTSAFLQMTKEEVMISNGGGDDDKEDDNYDDLADSADNDKSDDNNEDYHYDDNENH